MTHTERVYLVWERGPRGPVPAIYHGEIPKASAGKDTPPLAVHSIVPESEGGPSPFFDLDGSPRFGALAAAFPPPADAGAWTRPPEPARQAANVSADEYAPLRLIMDENGKPLDIWEAADAAIERGEPVSFGPGGASIPSEPRPTLDEIEETAAMLGPERLAEWRRLTTTQRDLVAEFYRTGEIRPYEMGPAVMDFIGVPYRAKPRPSQMERTKQLTDTYNPSMVNALIDGKITRTNFEKLSPRDKEEIAQGVAAGTIRIVEIDPYTFTGMGQFIMGGLVGMIASLTRKK